MDNFLDAFDTVKQAEHGATLHFTLPNTGELAYNGDTPLTITLKGPKSADARKAFGKMVARSKSILRKYDKKPDALISDEDSDTLRKIKSDAYGEIAIDWTGFESGGKQTPMTAANVSDVLFKYLDLFEQVQSFMEQKENFLKA